MSLNLEELWILYSFFYLFDSEKWKKKPNEFQHANMQRHPSLL